MSVPLQPPRRLIEMTVDGDPVRVPEGSTVLDACSAAGKDIPTLCYGDTLTPKNACRVCVVEVEGARTLAPACSRRAEPGMVVGTATERARHSRKIVLELLASTADLSTTPRAAEWIEEYGARPDRFGEEAATVAQPAKVDNELYVRDYSKCILCYKCVDACGDQWQNSFAISVAGRGFDAMISTEHDAPLTDSACVYCGNCVEVCPTGALSFKSEFDMRAAGSWDESRQTETTTICSYCGVGCNLTLHVQDNRIVKVSSPHDNPVTHGNLCIKGRFGFQHVQNVATSEDTLPLSGPASRPASESVSEPVSGARTASADG
ncbi:2Fe-2S iron-sulfur cluster-binding protein [Streptosporangium sp. NPDC002524]|uniref:2Fe-2S iron-sulfur cluster-binding protein n=1 Tax=Streptosporangium sp. NPDC002524 TaxID=3154537 RepID=UPI00332B082E